MLEFLVARRFNARNTKHIESNCNITHQSVEIWHENRKKRGENCGKGASNLSIKVIGATTTLAHVEDCHVFIVFRFPLRFPFYLATVVCVSCSFSFSFEMNWANFSNVLLLFIFTVLTLRELWKWTNWIDCGLFCPFLSFSSFLYTTLYTWCVNNVVFLFWLTIFGMFSYAFYCGSL